MIERELGTHVDRDPMRFEHHLKLGEREKLYVGESSTVVARCGFTWDPTLERETSDMKPVCPDCASA